MISIDEMPDCKQEGHTTDNGQCTDCYKNIINGVEQEEDLLKEVTSCLEEAVDLMDAIRQGEYEPDSFTTQPWTEVLRKLNPAYMTEQEKLDDAYDEAESTILREESGD